MPNHVHVQAAFRTAEGMLPRITAWKRYQAREINKVLQRSGQFYQEDGFDHLVRHGEGFLHYRGYIADNPKNANLKDGEYILWSNPNAPDA